ncbi:MAG: hypothetical protein ACO3JG_03615 [Luteolibacter sp.]
MENHKDTKYFVVSYGGVGTHMLMRMIKDEDWLGHVIRNKKVKHMNHPHHLRVPPQSFRQFGHDGRVKLIYLFGDPINSVLSHFRRRVTNKKDWCRHHCMNVQGDYRKFDARWDLIDYLENGVDLFRLEEHFDNWTRIEAGSIDYDCMILKYESAHRHEARIMDFLNTDVRLSYRSRNSDWRNESQEVRNKLVGMYGGLLEKCDSFPEIHEVKIRETD